MAWDAMAAFGSAASALILLIGSVAALVQLKHMRLANQLECYLQLTRASHSTEMNEARKFVERSNFSDPETLRAATEPDLDNRIRLIGVYFQNAARLINLGLLDENLFIGYIETGARLWVIVRPVVEEMRRRTGTPMFIDFEYMSYRSVHAKMLSKAMKRYPKQFLENAGLLHLVQASESLSVEQRIATAPE